MMILLNSLTTINQTLTQEHLWISPLKVTCSFKSLYFFAQVLLQFLQLATSLFLISCTVHTFIRTAFFFLFLLLFFHLFLHLQFLWIFFPLSWEKIIFRSFLSSFWLSWIFFLSPRTTFKNKTYTFKVKFNFYQTFIKMMHHLFSDLKFENSSITVKNAH